MARTGRTLALAVLVLLLAGAPGLAADGDDDLQGSVELTFRDVTRDGGKQKYDEDFDGLDSGIRLSHADLDWFGIDSAFADRLRFEAEGLGGDPYQRAAIRVGRKDVYDLSASWRSQRYIYDLFGVVDDLDGSSWNTKRRLADLDVKFHVGDSAEMFVEYGQVEREGTSVYLDAVNTELYRLDAPLDQDVRRFAVGSRFTIGRVHVLLRQMLRSHDTSLDRSTANDAGLSGDGNLARLDDYRWTQDDEGDADLTTLSVNAPIGDRVHVTASVFGTLLGTEKAKSRVALDASGWSFQGTCSVTGVSCSGRNPCDSGIPGNTCIPDAYQVTGGTSEADLEGDYVVLDADVSVSIRDDLDVHVQGRSVDREVETRHLRDLDGNGTFDDLEGIVGDTVPGSTTEVEYSVTTWTGLLEYAPRAGYRFRLGYRTIDRSLDRSGFEYGFQEYRNTSFESDSDDTVLVGLVVQPYDWFRFDADYEQGDIAQAFTAVAPTERDRLRVRARFTPMEDFRIDVGFLDYENTNDGVDFRDSGDCGAPGADIDDGCWSSRSEGTTLSVGMWHEVGPKVRYWCRWARHDVESDVRLRYDLALFNDAENGDSIYENVATSIAGQVEVVPADPWKVYLRGRIQQSDGSNRIEGGTFATDIALLQDFTDLEAGVTYSFPNGLYVGGRYRTFEYDDDDVRLDYDGDMVYGIAGYRF